MQEILFIALITFIGSFVGTLSGFGTSTFMIPVLLLFLPFAQTLLLVGIIHWFSNIWKMLLFIKGLQFRFIIYFGVPAIFATYVGAKLVFTISEIFLLQCLGAFFVIYAIFLYTHQNFKFPQNVTLAMIGGTLSGFFAGVFGVGGAIRGAFLSAFDLPKAMFIATLGAIGFAIDTTRLVTYFASGAQLSNHLITGLFVFIPISFLAAFLAKRVINHIPQSTFRVIISLFLFIIGIKFLFFP